MSRDDPIHRAPAAGLVLAGGRGRRLGLPKADLVLEGRTLVHRSVETLREAGLDPILVSVAPAQSLPPIPGEVEVVRDAEEGQGPLAALAGAFSRLAGRTEIVVVVACDLPLLGPAVVRALIVGLGEARGVVPVDAGGRPHPLLAAYRLDLASPLRELVAGGERAARSVLDLDGVTRLEPAALREVDPGLDALVNVNTPEDLERVRARLGP